MTFPAFFFANRQKRQINLGRHFNSLAEAGLLSVRDRAPVRAPMRVASVSSLHGVFVLPLAEVVRDRLEWPWTPCSQGLAVAIGLPGRPSLFPLSAHQVPQLRLFFNRCGTVDFNS